MTIKPLAYINVEERKLEWAEPITWHTPTIAQMDKIPLYTHPAKILELTEDEIDDVWAACSTGESDTIDMHLFAEAILRKAQEK